MSVEVIFRGVCLFREDPRFAKSNRRRLKDVLIPATDEAKAKEWELPQHFARLVVLDASGNVVSRHKLDGTRAEIADLLGGPCVLQPSFDRIQNLSKAVEATSARLKIRPPDAPKGAAAQRGRRKAPVALETVDVNSVSARSEQEEQATTRISCVGGAVSANEGTSAWRRAEDGIGQTASRGAPAALVTWRSLSGAAVIRLSRKGSESRSSGPDASEGDDTTSLVLDANHPRAYVYHYDEEWPTVSQLSGYDEGEPMFEGGSLRDRDFGWLYCLLDAKAFFDYRKDLSVPILDEADFKKSGSRNPGSSAGCFPGRL